jgi:WD40 repeat protein
VVSQLRFVEADHSLLGIVSYPDTRKFGAVIWDVVSGELQQEMELVGFDKSDYVHSLAVHDRGKILAIGANVGILLYRLSTGELVKNLDAPGWKSALDFSADGEMLVSGMRDGTAILWDWEMETELQRLVGHDGPVRALALSPNGKTLATGDGAGHVRLWEPQSGQEMVTFDALETDVQLLKFSADGQRLACWCREEGFGGVSEVHVWSIERKQQ